MQIRNLQLASQCLQFNEFLHLHKISDVPVPGNANFRFSQTRHVNNSLTNNQKLVPKQRGIHSKTEPIEKIDRMRIRGRLPELTHMKNALVEMKPNQIEKSCKIITNSNKNTKILNELIQLLREDKDTVLVQRGDKVLFDNKQKRDFSRRSFKKSLHTEPCNQFIQKIEIEQKEASKFQRGPKIINPEFMKICNRKLGGSRQIFSQERTRAKPKIKKTLNLQTGIGLNVSEDPQLLTFYHAAFKPVVNNDKSLDKDIAVQI